MNILITNDDGISSNGILALEKVLGKEHNTYLIAPLKERSATSMALSIYDSLRVEKVNENHYIVDGYPVDCVNIGLHGKIFPNIDLVLSGINRGVNMGHDVHYSGTVGAARHGAIHNRKSLAVSSGNLDKNYDYIKEAELVHEILGSWVEEFIPGIVYNINIPEKFEDSLSAIEIAKLGRRTYIDTYESKPIIGGISDFFLGGSHLGYVPEEGTDFDTFFRGKIPITPLSLDQTSPLELEEFKKRIRVKSK
ncbi:MULTISPECIES: 5'/3'-nucleotidase SurE [unclassified Leptospira]|uniref:5'/3'-nucleotidase SurE n=1 Tax=unclassified Leptospira TaxID=2633828 RepID=UPI0002BF3ED2|nr:MULTISPECIES: 5'/3'-nucleotidase SurE [unclassified Leptospira]EMK00014.1 5'/3'-nucleotidase SurE [Leptospira sp. B5-022]MCR1794533.1 5'/3'-nucleotidase SurE [Leptospira sp. id769339]